MSLFTNPGTAVVAIGGNSLIKDKQHESVMDQYIAAQETCSHIVAMIQEGWNVAISHGNGPQVGFILRRSELAANPKPQTVIQLRGRNRRSGRATIPSDSMPIMERDRAPKLRATGSQVYAQKIDLPPTFTASRYLASD